MYYPKNQIETNLYSNGEFVLEYTTNPYTGFYFKTSDGKYFTGKEPNNGPNFSLTLPPPEVDGGDYTGLPTPINTLPPDYRFSDSNINYSILTNQDRKDIPFFPIPYFPILTKRQITNGELTRFFCKKSNENIYTEVSIFIYNKCSGSSLYIPITLPWVISGDINLVATTNAKQIIFTEKKYRIDGLGAFLRFDYTQFYQG